MNIPIFQVDAFTDKMFSGNPAAVCLLEEWLTESQMQAIAAENNLSETAFLVPRGDDYALRWFTPQCEVRLCGHATLASAFVIFTSVQPGKTSVRFDTRSGILAVERRHDLLVLDFPAAIPAVCDGPAALAQGLKDMPEVVLRTDDNYFAVYASERQVRALQPDSVALKLLHPRGVAVTAPGESTDFVSRYFAPSYGITEDPVTGSTHCSLVPYWSGRLGKTQLHGRQVSSRGGDLHCELRGSRVLIAGRAIQYMQGTICL